MYARRIDGSTDMQIDDLQSNYDAVVSSGINFRLMNKKMASTICNEIFSGNYSLLHIVSI